MKDWQSQAHVKWEYKYHVVIVAKYRRKGVFGSRGVDRADSAAAVRAERDCAAGGECGRGSHTHGVAHTAEVQRCRDDGISEGQECSADLPGVVGVGAPFVPAPWVAQIENGESQHRFVL